MEETKKQFVSNEIMCTSAITLSRITSVDLVTALDNYLTGFTNNMVSLQNAPANICKHKWVIKENGIEYIVSFERKPTLHGHGYKMTKEIL